MQDCVVLLAMRFQWKQAECRVEKIVPGRHFRIKMLMHPAGD